MPSALWTRCWAAGSFPPQTPRGLHGLGAGARAWRTIIGGLFQANSPELEKLWRSCGVPCPCNPGGPRPVPGRCKPTASHLGPGGACNGRPSPLSTGKQAKQTELQWERPCSCSSCRGRHWPGVRAGPRVAQKHTLVRRCLVVLDRRWCVLALGWQAGRVASIPNSHDLT